MFNWANAEYPKNNLNKEIFNTYLNNEKDWRNLIITKFDFPLRNEPKDQEIPSSEEITILINTARAKVKLQDWLIYAAEQIVADYIKRTWDEAQTQGTPETLQNARSLRAWYRTSPRRK